MLVSLRKPHWVIVVRVEVYDGLATCGDDKMTILGTPLFWVLFISAILAARSNVDASSVIIQNQSHTRVLSQGENQRYDGPHTSGNACGEPAKWMSQMRERGIKAVDADSTFTWNLGVESVSVIHLRYYTASSDQTSSRQDVLPDSDSFSKLLVDVAVPAVTRRLQELLPAELAKARLARANGIIVVTLFDDPCLPVASRLNKLADPDLSPLIRAASSHSTARFYAVLQGGADVNAHDQKGFTPLMAASFAGNVEIAKVLLKHGARVNDQDIDGRTALHYAAEHPNASDVIPVLLKAGAEINMKLSPMAKHLSGATPLIAAAAMGNVRAVELLLAAGADRNALTRDRMTALDVARHPPIFATTGHSEVIELLERASN